MSHLKKKKKKKGILLLAAAGAYAGEADLAIPDLTKGSFHIAGQTITAWNLLFYGAWVIVGTLSAAARWPRPDKSSARFGSTIATASGSLSSAWW